MGKSSNNTETVFLLIGSNLGDRQAHLRICLSRLSALGKIISSSSVYETESWGTHDQPDFLNQVVKMATNKSPKDVLSFILNAEIELGRVRVSQEKWGSRIIDIDILLFGSKIIETERLTVPHPLLPARRFALAPLAEIAPDVVHPVLNKNILALLAECRDELSVRKFK